MTTRAKGITLPVWPYIRFTNNYFEVSTDPTFNADTSLKYTATGIAPITATSVSTVASPASVSITSQNASASFASKGGDVLATSGVGSAGNPSGNFVVKDTAGAGGTYNTAHLQMGNYHLWFDSTGKLRYKTSQPASDTDGTIVNNELSASATYDPPSLTTGSGATTTLAVATAALGDFVLVSFSNDLQGILVTGYVSSAGTVSVRFQNQTGGTIDLASGTLRVRVIKQ